MNNLIAETSGTSLQIRLDSISHIDCGNGSDGDLRVEAGKTLTINGTKNYKSIYVAKGATLTVSAWNGSIGGELLLKCTGSAVIDGSINVDAKGYIGGPGVGSSGRLWAYSAPGGGGYGRMWGAGGGSYGTSGAYGSGYNVNPGSAPGSCYGDVAAGSIFMGSGGGADSQGYAGGVGGGAIKIMADSIIISGTVSSIGGTGYGGGGSGGSVWILAVDVSINGSVSV